MLDFDAATKAVFLNLGITAIERGDAHLFQRFFATSRRMAYANSWTYITQAANCYALGGNSLGYKASLGRSLAALGYFPRPTDGLPCFHIINPLGVDSAKLCSILCKGLVTSFNCPVYVKKIDSRLRSELLNSGGYAEVSGHPWHYSAVLEDDTFPEIVIDLGDPRDLISGMEHNDLKDKLRRFRSRYLNSNIVWRDLALAHDDAQSVIETFFAEYVRDNISIPSDYRNMLVDDRASDRLIHKVVYIDGRPVALLIMEGIAQTPCIGLYCNLCLYKDYRYLSEYVVATALMHAEKLGFRYANLGGSETASLDAFKRKFSHRPRMYKALWLVYNP